MTPNERSVLEAIHQYQKKQGADLADGMQAIVEMGAHHEMVAEAVRALVGKVGELCDEVSKLNDRFGSYLTDSAREKGAVAQLRSEVREVQRKVASGG